MIKTMTIILNLPTDVEQQLKKRAARDGQTVEEYLQKIAALQAALPDGSAAASALAYPPGFSAEERSKAIRDWAESHPRVEHFVDDSRESIYAGRGE